MQKINHLNLNENVTINVTYSDFKSNNFIKAQEINATLVCEETPIASLSSSWGCNFYRFRFLNFDSELCLDTLHLLFQWLWQETKKQLPHNHQLILLVQACDVVNATPFLSMLGFTIDEQDLGESPKVYAFYKKV